MCFKKIYIEITNSCNLSCSFCVKNKREIRYMTREEFDTILLKIKDYTKYIYLHILGEPLMHPDIKYFIDLAFSLGFYINITTNGYLIDKIKNIKNIRQVNISLHSYNSKYHLSLDDYLNNIYNSIDTLIKNNTYVVLRLWAFNENEDIIYKSICNRYKLDNRALNKDSQIKINDRLYLTTFHEFIWPDLSNNYYEEKGTCYGLIDHIGILCDGTVVPCCLDSTGEISLGNIYTDELDKILSSKRVDNMIKGFKNHTKVEEYCKHCNFLEK